MQFPRLTLKRVIIAVGTLVFGGFGLLFVLLWVVSLWDIQKLNYQTKADAAQDRLFERGWLPPFIPESATQLSIVNNRDVNTSTGSFAFDPLDATSFVRTLQEGGPGTSWYAAEEPGMQALRDSGFTRVEYSGKEFCWAFLIHPEKGLCKYWGVRTLYARSRR